MIGCSCSSKKSNTNTVTKEEIESSDERVSETLVDQDIANFTKEPENELELHDDVTYDEIEIAKDTARLYYENTKYNGQITDITQIMDYEIYESAIIPRLKQEYIVAFYVTMTDKSKRMILLTKEKDSEWVVINEGV